MSKVQMLRSLVNQRLTAAAEEIFGLFERTIAEYEEELSASREENERQRRLLDAALNPEVRLHRADVQQLLLVKEEVPPEQQDWSSSLDQEDPEPPHIKDEPEELWIGREGDQLQGLEEAGIKDCGGPEPDRKSDPDRHQGPDTEEKSGDSSEPDTDDCDDWKRNKEPPSGTNSQRNVLDERCLADKHLCICTECGKRFGNRTNLKVHMLIHTGLKPFICTLCNKRFPQKRKLIRHMKRHLPEKTHWRVTPESHTGESHRRVTPESHTGESHRRVTPERRSGPERHAVTFTKEPIRRPSIRVHTLMGNLEK